MTLFSTLLSAQEPVVLRVPASLIVAPTSVTDQRGNFVNGLTAADFELYDNGVRQQIYDDDDFLPISLGVAIQGDLKKQALDRVHDLGPLLGALVVGVGGEAAVFRFNDKLEVVQNFTPDLGRLTRALRGIEFSRGPRDPVKSDPVKAVFQASQFLDRRREVRRRILLLVSEPHPGISDVGPDSALSNTLIYWLKIGHGADSEDLLSALTSYTGGRQFALGSERALERAITKIGEEVHGQYLLSYTPAHTNAQGFHRIQVTTKRVGMEVRSRPGYWPSN